MILELQKYKKYFKYFSSFMEDMGKENGKLKVKN